MFRDITIGRFFPGESFVHRLDPRSKILVVFAALILIFLCRNFYALGLVFLFVLTGVLISRLSFKLIFSGLKTLYIIIAITSLLQLFYNKQGEVLFTWGFFAPTDKGVAAAVFMAVRICSLILISSLLTYTTSPTLLTDALERLLSPLAKLKVPVHTLAMMMTIALRFIPTLVDETDRIMSAQKARGADMETGPLHRRAKAMIPVLVPLFVNAFRRAFELAYAMECRCYHGGDGRTRLRVMKLGWRDAVTFAATAAVAAGIILFNIYFEAVI
ncbi:MAG: energy-coupling factor transporter transmembrane protein EcfT [Clostridia bacterium]|nr:energy-coupling factor transporter transmembrane protein EcfT [Clostridia bacterium]MCR5688693.1 energy-coupling factor transporter transmembrane protein EcfT [Clostridiales bacterium]